MAMTSVAEKPGRPDAIIIGTKYQTELAEFGYLITPELIQRAKDGKRAESIMDNVILKTKGVTVVDVLASRLEHTILHEVCFSENHYQLFYLFVSTAHSWHLCG
jgi:hypothetical protein